MKSRQVIERPLENEDQGVCAALAGRGAGASSPPRPSLPTIVRLPPFPFPRCPEGGGLCDTCRVGLHRVPTGLARLLVPLAVCPRRGMCPRTGLRLSPAILWCQTSAWCSALPSLLV